MDNYMQTQKWIYFQNIQFSHNYATCFSN